MNKKVLIALGMGMALTLGSVERSEAWCLFGCPDVEVETNVSTNTGSGNAVSGTGNTANANIRDSVIVGGDVTSVGSNSIGAIGVNKGDINQSNSSSITNNQNIIGNDMRNQSINRNAR